MMTWFNYQLSPVATLYPRHSDTVQFLLSTVLFSKPLTNLIYLCVQVSTPVCTLQKSSTPANREKCTRFYLLFEHLRVWFRFCNLVNDCRSHVRDHSYSSSSGNSITKCNGAICYWNANGCVMYIHFPNTFVWAVWESTVNGATGYTNCIQLETISYCTDVMVGFHHFLFKVVWSNRMGMYLL